MTEPRKLVITDDDLGPAAPVSPPPAWQSTAQPPTAALPSVSGVRPAPLSVPATAIPGVGAPPAPRPAGGRWTGSTLGNTVVAAAVATLPAWGAQELVEYEDVEHLVIVSMVTFGVFGACFGAVFSAWDDLAGRVWESALPAALIGALVGALGGALSGAVAQELYGSIIENIVADAFRNGTDISPTDFKLNAARAIGWAMLGGGIGVASGVARRSGRKTVNGLAGGALGGAVGGFLFNYIGEMTDSDTLSRLVSFAVCGAAIGVAIGLIETVRRQAWTKIVAGGMAGKEFIIYHAATVFGSSPKATITLIKDASIAPLHFRIDEHGARRAIAAFDGCPLAVNGAPVTSAWLNAGDMIQAGSTTLVYQERAVGP